MYDDAVDAGEEMGDGFSPSSGFQEQPEVSDVPLPSVPKVVPISTTTTITIAIAITIAINMTVAIIDNMNDTDSDDNAYNDNDQAAFKKSRRFRISLFFPPCLRGSGSDDATRQR